MTHVEYFRLQAKKLLKDYKAKTHRHFYIDAEYLVLCEYGYPEEGFSLMDAQHILALMGGFDKWTTLIKASETELEIAKLLFENHETIMIEDWLMYVTENKLRGDFTPEIQLDILMQIWLEMPPKEGRPNLGWSRDLAN
jgi:hypothetical protein